MYDLGATLRFVATKKRAMALGCLSFLWISSSHAQEMSDFGGGMDKATFAFEYQSESAPDSRPGPHIESQKAFAAIPVFKNDRGTALSLLLKGERTLIGESLRFEDRGVAVPKDFGTAEIGMAWSQTEDSGNRRGWMATYGYAGRRLLTSGLSPLISATYMAEVPSGEGRSWIYFLNYSNNRVTLNHIPIPGFAYKIKERSRTLILGLPFLFGMWRADPIMFSVGVSPFFATTETSYRFWGPLMVYANAKWRPKSYQNLIDGSEDRLISDKKEAGFGLRAFFGRQGSLTAGYVWNFDRRFVLGRSLSDTNSNELSLEDSGGFQIAGHMTF